MTDSATSAELTAPVARPTTRAERVQSIDVLRGVALLGILVMNIPFFALSNFVWFNPRLDGGFDGADYAVWLGSHLVFDMKMMTIFSLLFGAGIAIFSDRLEKRTGRPGRLFYRRMLWLLVIGMLHAYLLWEGDILVMYAICGMLVYLFRRLSVRTLLIIAVPWILVGAVSNSLQGTLFEYIRAEAKTANEKEASGETLSDRETEAIETWDEFKVDFFPDESRLREEHDAYTGDYPGLVRYRAKDVFFFQTWVLLTFGIWRAGGLMILGMALLRAGVLSAEKPAGWYATMCAVGYGVGLPIVYYGSTQMHAHDFDAIWMFRIGWNYNYVGSLFVAAGHVGLIMLVCRAGAFRLARMALAAVGQMALTNYLMHSVICSTLFFGYGLGWYGELSRRQLMVVVAAVWAFQLVVSPIWLQRFRFGPAEWVWRSLTYGTRQPLARTDS